MQPREWSRCSVYHSADARSAIPIADEHRPTSPVVARIIDHYAGRSPTSCGAGGPFRCQTSQRAVTRDPGAPRLRGRVGTEVVYRADPVSVLGRVRKPVKDPRPGRLGPRIAWFPFHGGADAHPQIPARETFGPGRPATLCPGYAWDGDDKPGGANNAPRDPHPVATW